MNSKAKIRIDRMCQLWFGEKVCINLFFVVLIFTAFYGKYLSFFLISWGIAVTHEMAHIAVGKSLGIKFSGVSIQPFGLCARLKDSVIKSPAKEIITAVSGPLCNFLISFLCLMLRSYIKSEYINYTLIASTSMGVLNLLPCLPLDGGRILRAGLCLGSDVISAWRTTMKISRVISAVILTAGVYLLLTTSFQFSLILIGVFLIGNLCTEQKNISHRTLREILYYNEKLEPDKLNKASLLVANQDLPARAILRRMSYHKYYIVEVVDDNKKITAHLSEGRILEFILKDGIRITLKDIVDKLSQE